MRWIELTIKTTSIAMDLVTMGLTDLGFDSFIIDDDVDFHQFLENNTQYWDYVDEDLESQMAGLSQVRLFLEETPDSEAQIASLAENLSQLREQFPLMDFGSLEITQEYTQNEDWENNWKQYYEPREIGNRLLVVPQWMEPPADSKRIPIFLDPGMIFGTGNHASTQMCMVALENAISGGERVIDLGSGSGILSFAALLLGANTAVGVDIDPKAEDIARDNGALNGLGADRFTAVTGDVISDQKTMEQLSQGGYDIVLANIVADVIIPLAPVVPHFLREDGVFICSGILNTRLGEVISAIEAAGLTVVAQCQTDDWCQLTVTR